MRSIPALLVVLGHEGCGAIQAALSTIGQGVRHHSRIQLLVDGIVPGLQSVDSDLPPETMLAQAVEMNVRRMVRTYHESPEGQARQKEGRVKCVGAIYEIETGRVRLLDQSHHLQEPVLKMAGTVFACGHAACASRGSSAATSSLCIPSGPVREM